MADVNQASILANNLLRSVGSSDLSAALAHAGDCSLTLAADAEASARICVVTLGAVPC